MSGPRASSSSLLLLGLLILASGCNYGFRSGGGFPPGIRTVYIEPFENRTDQFEIEQQLFATLLEQLPRQLGVRPAGRDNADAVVRGAVVRYDDLAQNFRPGLDGQTPTVLQNQVRITIAIEIIDTRNNVILWDSQGVVGQGEYSADSQSNLEGRTAAISNLVRQIIDGAQSQW